MMRRDTVPQMLIYPDLQLAGPSTYLRAIDSIAEHFLPSALDNLDNEEYNRQLDHYIGRDALGEEDNLEESGVRQVLVPTKIHNSIHNWILGSQDYYMLVETIDYQYDFNPKIQYWEDFLSRLAFFNDLDKQDEYFMSVSLADHLHQLADYQPLSSSTSEPTLVFQDPLIAPCAEQTPRDSAWVVKVVPCKFVLDYQKVGSILCKAPWRSTL